MESLKELMSLAKKTDKERLVVVAAEDDHVIEAVLGATKEGIIEPILVGDESKIRELIKSYDYDDEIEIINASSLEDSATKALTLFKDGKADFIMKGLIDTSVLLKNVLKKEYGLREDNLLSHVMLYEIPALSRVVAMSDGGMNIQPDLNAKYKILLNMVDVLKSLDYEKINIAGLAAKEKVSDKMVATVDARALEEMVDIKGVTYEGPLALDLVFDAEAAKLKNFKSEISGRVDGIIVPNIETGNALGKSMTYLANATSAGIIMGAKVPIVLVSRADDAQAKLNSIALGKLISSYKRRK